MVADSFADALNQIAYLHQQFEGIIDTWFLVFCRLLGFISQAPVFNRKDVPFNIKISFAMIFSWVLVWSMPTDPVKNGDLVFNDNAWMYCLQMMINGFIGAFFGLIAEMILVVVNSAGALMTNQIGLSSAMTFDPTSKKQVMIFEKLLGMIAIEYFIHLGGIYWLIEALRRTFEIFPVETIRPDFVSAIDVNYLIYISGNSLAIAVAMVAPIFVVTMCIDLILGIVNRTAQQIQVFQLSFALKPSIGAATFLATMPIFMKFLFDYFNDFSKIF